MKNFIAESLKEKDGDIVMEMADQLRNEGFHEGFSQGIRYGLKTAIILKFGENADPLLTQLNEINDVEKLTRINEAIVFMQDKKELQEIMI